MAIAQVQTSDRNMNQLQQNLSQAVQPLLNNPVLQGVVLPNVSLAVGLNAVPHKLGRKLQGWTIVRIRAQSSIYDTQDANGSPDSNLLLNSSAAVVVDLYVF